MILGNGSHRFFIYGGGIVVPALQGTLLVLSGIVCLRKPSIAIFNKPCWWSPTAAHLSHGLKNPCMRNMPSHSSTRQRLAAITLVCVVAVLQALFYLLFVYGAGFADGHLTDYQRSASFLFKVICVPGTLLAGHAVYLAIKSPKQNIRLGLILNTWATLFVFLFLYVANEVLYSQLNHGQGG